MTSDIDSEEGPLELTKASIVEGERIIDKPELPKRGLVMHMQAEVTTIEGSLQIKEGTSKGFKVFSDEPPQIGGTGKYPAPMSYMALGIGMCLLTQMVRYAHMMKIEIRSAQCFVDLHYSVAGSVLAGTVHTNWHEVKTRLQIDSDEAPDRIAALVRNAKGGCTAENLAAQAVPIHSEIILNGESLPFDGSGYA